MTTLFANISKVKSPGKSVPISEESELSRVFPSSAGQTVGPVTGRQDLLLLLVQVVRLTSELVLGVED